MKLKLLRQVILMSKYGFLGICLQAFLCTFLIAKETHAQKVSMEEVYITINLEDATIKEAFDLIALKTNFKFAYELNKVDLKEKVDSKRLKTNYEKETLANLLRDISKTSNLKFKRINNNIFVSSKSLFSAAVEEVILDQNQQKVSGVVSSAEDNQPLPGVSILIKGTQNGTITDFNGEFTLEVPEGGDNALVFSFIGFTSQEVLVNNQSVINVVMQPDMEQLEEVIVVGYGTVRKSDLTGSIASVKSEDLNQGVAYSPDVALRGRAAGVQVTQVSGQPGSEAVVRIRGTNSISGNNDPLYVVDGTPISGGLNAINPADIQSVEVLKDASSTAIYGSRASNGVVLITTKTGKKGKGQISFDMYYGVQTLDKKLELTDAKQWGELMNEAAVWSNPDASNLYDPDTLKQVTDWQNEIFTNAPVENYQLGFSGGSDKIQYSISGNYFNQDGIILNSNFKRYSLRTNISANLTDRFKVGTNLNFTRRESRGTNTGSAVGSSEVQLAIQATPILPTMDADGKYLPWSDLDDRKQNPVAMLALDEREPTSNRFLGNVFMQYDILDGLNFKTSLGFDVSNDKNNNFFPSSSPTAYGYGSASINQSNNFYWVSTNTLNFDKVIADKHVINAFAGFTAERMTTESTNISGRSFLSDATRYHAIESGDQTALKAYSGYSEWSLASWLGRVNYSFDDKYLISITGRTDGASRFAEGNKWAFFPSAAVGWKISNEAFMENAQTISNLKLRASIGKTGEQGIPPYRSFAAMSTSVYTLGSGGPGTAITGAAVSRLSQPELTWETTTQMNAGLDVGLFQDRVTFGVDYYFKRTENALMEREIGRVTGLAASTALFNVGTIENKGFEIDLFAHVLTGEFQWDARLNLGFNKNKVTDLGGEDRVFPTTGANGAQLGIVQNDLKSNASILLLNQPLGIVYGYENDGVFANQEEADLLDQADAAPGVLRMRDISGPEGIPDGKIDSNDRTIIGNTNPKNIGGFTNNFSYKGFDLSIFAQWSLGNDIFWLGRLYNMNMGPSGRNALKEYYDNRWTPENPNATEPAAGPDNRVHTDNSSLIFDGSYLRIKNVSLGYTIPMKSVQRLRVYASVDNLFTFTKYPGFDPEGSSFGRRTLAQGVDVGTFPNAKTYIFGLNLNF